MKVMQMDGTGTFMHAEVIDFEFIWSLLEKKKELRVSLLFERMDEKLLWIESAVHSVVALSFQCDENTMFIGDLNCWRYSPSNDLNLVIEYDQNSGESK